eukprot:450016-Pelagomonas_calceolata.AAC.2
MHVHPSGESCFFVPTIQVEDCCLSHSVVKQKGKKPSKVVHSCHLLLSPSLPLQLASSNVKPDYKLIPLATAAAQPPA